MAVISTYDAKTKRPEAALVTYAEKENLELYFGTFKNERKYTNLQSNPYVAFVVGWDNKIHMTLQYEGIAKELNKKEAEKAKTYFSAKSNSVNTAEFLYHPLFRFFVIKPLWVRYSNYTKFELSL